MKASRPFLIILMGLAALCSVVFYWTRYHGAGIANAAPLTERNAARSDAAPSVRASSNTGPATSSSTRTREELGAQAEQRKRADLASIMGGLQNSRGFQSFVATEARARLEAPYASLFKSLNLPDAKADKIKSLLADKQLAQADINTTVLTQGLDPSTPGSKAKIAELRAQADADIESKIHEELGDESYALYRDYAKTLPERNTVSVLAERLSQTPTPLDETQTEQMVQILAKESPPRDNILARPTIKARVSQTAIEQAAKILSPPQLDTLKDLGRH